MTTRSPTAIMIRYELIGFARSKVMLVLWIILPLLAIGGYLLISNTGLKSRMGDGHGLSAAKFTTIMMTSLAGTIAALMVAVDMVSERQRKVYELFVIRPVRREIILWAKFIAVFVCVGVACVTSMLLGVVVDLVQGDPVNAAVLHEFARSLASLVGGIALSASIGVVTMGVTVALVALVMMISIRLFRNSEF
jgi:ABC-type transport system involved in multi-copper enzyme maturation permease subunit